jgi:transcriptional regulator with XRE-family HTH domain
MAVTLRLLQNASMGSDGELPDGGSSDRDVADRLIMLRECLGFDTQSAFAVRLGIRSQALNHFETVRRPLTLALANTIRRMYRIPLDWLFHGDRSGLSMEQSSAIPFLVDWREKRGRPPLQDVPGGRKRPSAFQGQ